MINPRRYYYSKPQQQPQQQVEHHDEQNQRKHNSSSQSQSQDQLSSLISSSKPYNHEQKQHQHEEISSISISSIPIQINEIDDSFILIKILKNAYRNTKTLITRSNITRVLSTLSLCFLFLISIHINNQSIIYNDVTSTRTKGNGVVGRSIYELTSRVNCVSCRDAFKIRNGGKVLLTQQNTKNENGDGDNDNDSIIPLELDKNLGNVLVPYKIHHKKQATTSQTALEQNVENNDNDHISKDDIPIFLHIPRSGGLTVRDVLGGCLKLVLTADFGNKEKYLNQKSLQFLQTKHKALLLNVDTSYHKGIKHTKEMNLLSSSFETRSTTTNNNRNLIDVIVTKDIYSLSSTLLDNTKYQGKVFIMLRDPIERLVSLYHYLGVASWDINYDPDLQFISLEMFARSNRKDNNNYIVRLLSNTMDYDEESVTEEHLDIAKEVLRKKFIIGLLNHKQESITRLQQYFKWKMNYHHNQQYLYNSMNMQDVASSPTSPSFDQSSFCQEKLLTWGWSNKNHHPNIEETSPAYELLQKKNALDIALYEYAKLLYEEQGTMINNMVKEERFRMRQEHVQRTNDALLMNMNKEDEEQNHDLKDDEVAVQSITNNNNEQEQEQVNDIQQATTSDTTADAAVEGDVIQDIVNSYSNPDNIKVEDIEILQEDEGGIKEAIMADEQNP